MRTPILDMLKNYANQNSLRFHMPGHKGNDGSFFNSVFPFDITELDFSDNLLQPTGVIKQAQNLFANAVGAQNCFFVTNGSTCGVLALVACSQGKLLVERASHASVFNAIDLFGKNAVVANNRVKDGKFCPITLKQIEECADKHKDIKTILLTSPNYYGECCEIEKIYEFCKNKNITLFIDGAHGAHFGFSNLLPQSIAKNCHACVVSTHKTMHAMTQTACVFAQDSVALQIKQKLNVFNSSSPNYLLLASIDYARAYFENQVKQGHDKQTFEIIEQIKSLPNLSFLQNNDFSRLVLDNTNGARASEWLKQKGVYVEFNDLSHVVLIVSLAENKQNLLQLKKVLATAQDMRGPSSSYVQYANVCDEICHHDGETMLVDIDRAEGYICAQQCGGYPPCIPLFLKGEKISRADRLFSFNNTFGLYNDKIKVFKK